MSHKSGTHSKRRPHLRTWAHLLLRLPALRAQDPVCPAYPIAARTELASRLELDRNLRNWRAGRHMAAAISLTVSPPAGAGASPCRWVWASSALTAPACTADLRRISRRVINQMNIQLHVRCRLNLQAFSHRLT